MRFYGGACRGPRTPRRIRSARAEAFGPDRSKVELDGSDRVAGGKVTLSIRVPSRSHCGIRVGTMGLYDTPSPFRRLNREGGDEP